MSSILQSIVTAVAEKYGVASEDITVQNRVGNVQNEGDNGNLSVGGQDRFYDNADGTRTRTDSKTPDDEKDGIIDAYAVQFGGSGVGGNATIRFDFDPDLASAEQQANYEAAAQELHQILSDAREADVLDTIFLDDGEAFNWTTLANDAGANFVRDRVGKIDVDGLWDNAVREFTHSKTGDSGVRIGGKSVGGNAVARFEDAESAASFENLIESLLDLGNQSLAEDIFNI